MAEIAKTEAPGRHLSVEAVQSRAEDAAKGIIAAKMIGNHPYLDLEPAERALAVLDASAEAVGRVLRDFRDHVAALATEQEIGRSIATIIGVFGTPAGANAKIYTGVMIERVARQRPSIAALEQAVAQVIDTSRFPPAVVEVLDALSARQGPIAARLALLSEADDVRDRLARAIEYRRVEIQRYEAGDIDR